MILFQHDDQALRQIYRFPVQHRESLTALIEAFPDAIELAFTNPPLAIAIANARRWDTFTLAKVDRRFIGSLLRQRRREICGALGFPSSARVVRILGKVPPEACRLNVLAKARGSFRNPDLLAILSHLSTIGAEELKLAADLGSCHRISPTLFSDLAAQLNRENDDSRARLLRQTETLLELRGRECRTLRSVRQVRRCLRRLWRGVVDLQNFKSTNEEAAVANIPFPPVPLPGSDEIQPIDSATLLIEEARAMGHCVLNYAGRVAEEDGYLYRVLNPERATLFIGWRDASWQMEELAGVRNQPVSRATEETVESWLRCAPFASFPTASGK